MGFSVAMSQILTFPPYVAAAIVCTCVLLNTDLFTDVE